MGCEDLNEIIKKVEEKGIKSLNTSEIKKLLICSIKSHNIGCNCGKEINWEKI